MDDQDQNTLREKLVMKQKEIDLLVAIDRLRDESPGPGAVLSGIARLLVETLSAQVCLIFLLDRETSNLELAAICERCDWYDDASQEVLGNVAQEALLSSATSVWPAGTMPLSGLPAGVHNMAVPITFGEDQKLGVIVLARAGAPFGDTETELVSLAENQIDSAIIQGYTAGRLSQAQRELETIFRLDHIRDQGMPLNEMLNAVIHELTSAIEAEMGLIMLYDLAGKKLETRASTHTAITSLPFFDEINRTAEEALRTGQLAWRNAVSGDLRSLMCLPLILNEQIIGVIGVVNRFGPGGFTAADRRMLAAIGSQIDTAIYERNEIRQLRRVLERSVDPRVMERLLASLDTGFLKGELVELTVLYADIRGSTALAERTQPETLVEFIRDYLSQMTSVVLRHEGTIDKFVGDEVMALFGVPIPQPDHALRAIRAGLEMQAEYGRVQQAWRARGLAPTSIGVGIATGEMIAGEMGSAQRSSYTVIGRAANLGSRICEIAKPGQVLVSPRTYELVRERVEVTPVPGNQFKGVAGPVTVYQVIRVLE